MCRLVLASVVVLSSISAEPATASQDSYDVVVYAATPAGIMAAIAAKQLGSSVVLLQPGTHIGASIASGLGGTDIGDARYVGGLAERFFERVGKRYKRPYHWNVEPRVAEEIFRDLINEHDVSLKLGWHLSGVVKEGVFIRGVRSTNNTAAWGKSFVDASYEGDLFASAGVSYRVGREARTEFNESLAGVYTNSRCDQIDVPISPYDSSGALLPGVSPNPILPEGSADRGVPAYNYRLCVTRADDRIPFLEPPGYNPRDFELLARYLRAKPNLRARNLFNFLKLPGGKYDLNNKGPFSTDLIGGSAEYPEATRERRREIAQAHERYIRGLLWFLRSDPRVPRKLQAAIKGLGLCRDEFIDNGNWPYQLYIREARRMRGEYILTQHDIEEHRKKPDSVGVATKPIESHHVQRYITEKGLLQNEGFVYTRDAGNVPYEIPYRALLPRRDELVNLIVPVALSATHIAYSSVRMEPVYMILGESAGVAAALAARANAKFHEVPYPDLKRILSERKQILEIRPADKNRRGRFHEIGGCKVRGGKKRRLKKAREGRSSNQSVPHGSLAPLSLEGNT